MRSEVFDRVLIAAAGVGFLLAVSSAVGGLRISGQDLADGVVAQVNDAQILTTELNRALEALARDKRNPLRDADRQRALDTLIDEELLVQRAQTIGLLDSDRGVRKAMVDAMLQYILAQAQISEPEPAALRAFYTQRQELARPSMRLHLRHAVVDPDQARQVQEELQAGVNFEQLLSEQLSALPDRQLPMPALDNYLPSAVLEQVGQLDSGDVVGPISTPGSAHFLWAKSVERPSRPEFEEVEALVRHAWWREQRESATRKYVDELRRSADIQHLSPTQQ